MKDPNWYLGRVARVHAPESGQSFVLLEPLYELDDTCREVEARLSEFPNQGFVIWFGPRKLPALGCLFWFKCEESETFDERNQNHCRLRVQGTPQPVTEVLDLRGYGEPEAIRAHLSRNGVHMGFRPQPDLYVRIGDSEIVGPLPLKQETVDPNTWFLDSGPLSEKGIGCFELEEGDVEAIKVLGTHCLVMRPNSATRTPVRTFDWADDEIALRHALRDLARWDKTWAKSRSLTKKAVQEISERLSTLDLSAVGDSLRRHRLERARRTLGRLLDGESLVSDALEEFLAIPRVAQGIEEHQRSAAEKARLEALAALEEDEANRYRDLEQLNAEVTMAREEAQRLEERKAHLRDELVQGVAELSDELDGQVRRAVEKPAAFLAEALLIRAVARQLEEPVQQSVVSTRSNEQVCSPAEELGELALVETMIGNRLAAAGVSPEKAKDVVAAFLSGGCVVLEGPRAVAALRCAADVLTAGEVAWLPVSSAFLEPGDLLARTWKRSAGGSLGTRNELISLLVGAPRASRLRLVVLDGINLAPIEAYLMPLLQAYVDADRSHGKRPLPIPHDIAAVGQSESYWPRNILLAGILREGPTALRVPTCLWENSVYLQAPRAALNQAGAATSQGTGGPGPSVVTSDTWECWKGARLSGESNPCAQFLEKILAQNPQLIIPEKMAEQFFGSRLLVDPSNVGAALSATLGASIVPAIVTAGGDGVRVLKGCGVSHPQFLEIAESVARVLRPLVGDAPRNGSE